MLGNVIAIVAALSGASVLGYLVGWEHRDRECKREDEDYSDSPPNCS